MSQPQSHEIGIVGDPVVNPAMRNIDSRRHSSPSLSPPPHQMNRQKGMTSPLQILSRPLTSPPPLIPSPARDPEKSKHLNKDLAKSPLQRDEERARLFSTDRNRQQPSRDQGLRDADKGRISSRDQGSNNSEKNRSSRELGQKDKGEQAAKEPEKRRQWSKDSDRGRPLSKDSEKGKQVNRDSDKGRQASRESSNREPDKSKSSSRDQSYKDMEKARSVSRDCRDAGLRDSEKHRQYSRETGKDSGQGKDRPSSRDSDKGIPLSRDSSYRSTERKDKDSGPGKNSNLGSQSKQAGGDGKSPRLAPAGSGQSSPPVGTAVLTSQQRGNSTKQAGKQGKHGGKDQDFSANLSLLPRPRSTPASNILQPKDKPSSGKESSSGTGKVMPASHHKDSVVAKSCSSQPSFQKSNSRKSNDYTSATITAMKSLWPSKTPAEDDGVKRGSVHLSAPAAASAAKDKHPKVKTAGSREVSIDREREKTLPNSNSSSKIPYLNNNTKATGTSNPHPTNPSTHNSSNSKAPVLGNSTKAHGKGEKHENLGGDRSSSKSRENYSCPERKNSSGLDNILQLQHTSLVPEKVVKTSSQSHTKQTSNQLSLSSREKKKAVKPPTVPLLKTDIKTDPNGTSTVGSISSSSCPASGTSTVAAAGQSTRRPGHPTLFSSLSASSSDSSESDTQTQTEDDDLHKEDSRSELQDHHGLLTQGTEDEGDGPEDDHERSMDDKHHEDDSDGSGSAKRRYPRRSARARSNMFFGLTPFYGVRSYGEEDLAFYNSGDAAGAMVKRRHGGRKKSAEGQVDGADDISTSSSSGDSGEDEDSGLKQRGKDPYYYNFTRTIINPGEGLPSIEGIDQCLGRGSQLQRFLKDEEQQQRVQGKTEEDMLSAL